jgi:hypothetical protein
MNASLKLDSNRGGSSDGLIRLIFVSGSVLCEMVFLRYNQN